MSEIDTCKRTIEFTVPVLEVEAEIDRAATSIQKKAKLPGFRPGKTPLGIIKTRYEEDIRSQVVDNLVNKHFGERTQQDRLQVVGSPRVTDVHLHKGEPLTFKVEFEIAPEWELGQYTGLEAPYEEPKVADEDVTTRLNALREQKADYINIDPRPAADGDYAVVAMKSIGGVEGEPIQNDEMVLGIGDAGTMPEFSEALRGMTPGDEKEVTVKYPDEYGHKRLAGREVTFHLTLKVLRKKELPELNDDFAQDVGDFKTLEELSEEIRRQILREREQMAKTVAQEKLIDKLVEGHAFPVPDAYTDRQIEMNLETRIRELAMQGVDPRSLKIDWEKLKESQKERALRDVRASLILDRIGERESIAAMQDEVDREIHRISKQVREPAAAVRMRMEKDGSLARVANRIRTEKVLNFLFENARKVAAE